MKKETGIAIFLGILFGIVVATALIAKTRQDQMQNAKPITSVLSITPSVNLKTTDYQPLSISQPESGIIVDTKSVTIKGKVGKNSLIVVQSPVKNMVVVSKGEDFSIDFPLALGENMIHISAYAKDSSSTIQEKELLVNYLTEQ